MFISLKTLTSALALTAGMLFAQSERTPSTASQTSLGEPQHTFQQPLPHCGTVSLASRSTGLSKLILADMLRKRGEFQNAGLTLTDRQADVELTVTNDVAMMFQTRAPVAISTGSEHDVQIRAVRKGDGKTVTGTLFALGDFEGIVAGKTIDILHALCPGVVTTSQWRRAGHAVRDDGAAARLREAHTLSVVSCTSRADEYVISRAIASREEIVARQLQVFSGEKDADLRLEITHDINNIHIWRYDLLNHDRQSLFVGRVVALSEPHAVKKIVDSVTRQLSGYNPTSSNILQSSDRDRRRPGGIWHIRQVTDNPQTRLEPLEIRIDDQGLVVHNSSGQTVLTIEASDVEDVDNSVVLIRMFDFPSSEDVISFLGAVEGGPSSAAAALGILATWTGVAALFTPFHTQLHFIDVAWSEDDVLREARFEVRGRDVNSLMNAMRGMIRDEER
jgi:hypothetical protein